MKSLIKISFLSLLMAAFFTSCDKVGSLPTYAGGTASVLTASSTTIAPVMADSDKIALTLTWTNPAYAADSSTSKYIVEVDSSGRSFSKEVTRTVSGALTTSFKAKELNSILLNYGLAYNTAYNMDFRITSSYANNNDLLKSNTVVVKYTTYVVPPKVTPPTTKALFLVGAATSGGWGNPVPTPAQQFTKIDSVTYQGTFYLNGGQQYLMLPLNGDWTHKYSVADNSLPGLSAGGSFGYDLSSNFPGPAATGTYKIVADFQHGTFTVTKVALYALMYVPGDYQGWAPATAPTMGSPKSDGSYDGYINMPAGGTYQFKMNTTPDWNNSWGDGGGGTLSTSGGNMQVAGAGYYHLVANTTAKTWSATATSWSMIGSFAASGWSNDVDMVYSSTNNNWTGTITTAAGDQFKFRANHDWGTNLGDAGASGSGIGSLSYGGNNIGDATTNIAVPAGTHKVTLFLNNSGYYSYMIQ